MEKRKTKCDFCKYWTGRSCMATPNSIYCRDAQNEFYAWLEAIKKKRR